MTSWWFKITTNMWPVFAVGDEALAKDTLKHVPGGHVFGPFPTPEEAQRGAETIQAADEAALGGR